MPSCQCYVQALPVHSTLPAHARMLTCVAERCGKVKVKMLPLQPLIRKCLQSLEKEMALAGGLDTYEFEGPDRAEFLQDLSEFQLAVVRL